MRNKRLRHIFGGVTREQCATTAIDSTKSQTHSAKRAVFGLFSPNGSAVWPRHHRKLRAHRHQSGGMTPSKAPTRRRRAVRGLRMAQNPHRSRLKCAASPTRPGHSTGWHEKTRPAPPLHRHFRKKTRPASAKTPNLGHFECAGRTFSRSRPPSDEAGRTFSHTRRDNAATLKPTTPLLTSNKGPLKPTLPLHPKTAPKPPISRPQRRWRFQLRLDLRPQRRWRFQTARPPSRQGLAVAPAGSGVARPGDRWAPNVTNVVKPEQFEPPCECSCYKRRQSASKNLDFQRKSRRIDDVCNNRSEIHTKNTSD